MARKATQPAVDDPEALRHLVAEAMWQRFSEYPQMNANEYARIAVKTIIQHGWRPARLVDLMLDPPEQYDGTSGDRHE